MKLHKQLSLILVIGILLSLLAGCGASPSYKYEGAYEAPAAMNSYDWNDAYVEEAALSESASGSNSGSGASSLPANRKFIITVDMDAETEDLDSLLTDLDRKLSALSGYVESQNIYNGSSYSTSRHRSVSMTLRIPADKLNAFTEEITSISNVISSRRSTEDVTLNYVDTQSRITALETEQTRLLELMEKAETMSDLLEIEARLTEVRSDLEMYASRLRVLDNQIDYATVYLSIDEVKEYTPIVEKTRWESIRDGFAESISDLGNGILDLFAWIVIDIPYLLFYALVIFLIVLLIRFISRKRKAAKAKKMAAMAARYQQAQQPVPPVQQQNPKQ